MSKIYNNITFNVDDSIVEQWKKWMKEDYLPLMAESKNIDSIKLLNILVEEEMGGQSFALMFESSDLEKTESFAKTNISELHRIMSEKFGQKVVYFNTLLEEEFSI